MSEENQDLKIDINDVDMPADKKLAFTKTFTVDYIDPDSGKRCVGQFTVKRATLGDLSQFGVIKAQLNGGLLTVDPRIDWMNEMIAFCQVALTDAPQWWDPRELYDQTLLDKVYRHVRSFQDSFRNRRVDEQRSAAPTAGGNAAGDRVAPAVVVQEVQQTA